MGFFEEMSKKDETEKIKKTESIPYNYHEISLASCNKLSTPFKIHVRDYYNADVLKISQAQNVLKEILNFLVDGIYEDVDPYFLHEKELEEIMLNIYGAFWNPIIEGYYYPSMVTDEQLKEEIEEYNKQNPESKKANISEFNPDLLYTSIDIKKIEILPIKEGFKEPIVCEAPEDKIIVHLRLPRIGDLIRSVDHIDKKYAIQDQVYRKEENIEKDRKGYEEYSMNRKVDTGIALMAMCIIKHNGEDISNDIELQMDKYKSLPRAFWQYCWSQIQEVNSAFGANPEVEVLSPLTKRLVKRRCQFQLLDLIPGSEVSSSSRYVSRYGD